MDGGSDSEGALRPPHAHTHANEEFVLAEGVPFAVNTNSGPTRFSCADVSMVFGASPHLRISTHTHPDSMKGAFAEVAADPVVVEFPTLGASVTAIRTRHGGSVNVNRGACFTSEYIPARDALEIRRPGAERLTQVRFGILNFVDFFAIRGGSAERVTTLRPTPTGPKPEDLSQVVLVAGPWRLRVRSLLETKNLVEEAHASGGYAVTHAGIAEHADGGTFASEVAEDLLTALFYFLSFSRGFWAPVVLPQGTDASGAVVWEQWGSRMSSGWTTVYHWLDEHHPEWLADAFPGFLAAWDDRSRRESLRAALYWYLAANQSVSGVDVCLILSQTALELLAWSSCVIEQKLVSAEGFNDLRASDKLRMVLSSNGIPLDIPPELKDLTTLAARFHWLDGPQAVTEIRNELVHPGKKRKVLPSDGLPQAWMLSQQYVELLLLRMFNYRGAFSDRVRHTWVGQEARVPWAR